MTINASYAFLYTIGGAPITLDNDISLLQPINLWTDAEGGDPLTLSGDITGQSALYKLGSGDATLAGTNTYAGDTYVQAGRLLAGSTTGLDPRSAFAVAAGATLDLNGFDSTIGSLSGAGTVTNSAAQSATLTVGADGSTTTFAGTITATGASAASAAASGAVALAACSRGELALVKTGKGVLLLTGASGYGGGTTIRRGALVIGDPNALGTGDVANKALLATAAGNRRIEVGGDFVQHRSGTLRLAVDADARRVDRLKVGGDAQLDGTLRLDLGGVAPASELRFAPIGVAGAWEGEFRRVETSLPTVSAEQDGRGIVLRQGSFAALSDALYSANARRVASYLDARPQGQMTRDFAEIVSGLNAHSPLPEALAQDLERFHSGAITSFLRDAAFNNVTFRRMRFDAYAWGRRAPDGTFSDRPAISSQSATAEGSGLALETLASAWSGSRGTEPAPPSPWRFYATGRAIFAKSRPLEGAGRTVDSTTDSIEIGADYLVSPRLLVGGFLRQDHARATLDDLGSRADMTAVEPGFYAAALSGRWFGNLVASQSFGDVSYDRVLAFDARNLKARGTPDSRQSNARLSGGYVFGGGNWIYGPLIGLGYSKLSVAATRETEAPGLGLSVREQHLESLRGRLGASSSYAWTNRGTSMRAYLSASWLHEFLDQGTSVSAGLDSVGADTFSIWVPAADRDALALDVGASLDTSARASGFIGYSAITGTGAYTGQSVQAGLRLQFQIETSNGPFRDESDGGDGVGTARRWKRTFWRRTDDLVGSETAWQTSLGRWCARRACSRITRSTRRGLARTPPTRGRAQTFRPAGGPSTGHPAFPPRPSP